ncbi:hypothetical protein XBJ2_1390006 [Xenorhabdus bovienii str. Jollieti]|uniref:Uncharacterized protein n=1 Tax=Xenorhabdus bovienii (strain SS-2004) TaxID=406818 RepID=D3V7H0_XENBS|nr:hypothetical protein XBJ1_2658 [Xenorhabdus bovienii SS-2004]CDH27656.1 hypothetical protein XBJ2_1390006 [Xenorhabdus bovienii str. Jollieti]
MHYFIFNLIIDGLKHLNDQGNADSYCTYQ